MSGDAAEAGQDPLTERILGCAFRVMNTIGNPKAQAMKSH